MASQDQTIEVRRGYWRKWSRNNKARRKEIDRNYLLKKRYGITLQAYNAMLTAQGGGCAICGARPETVHHGTLPVDHCHATGKTRGLLCDNCNRALGLLKDDVERVRKMAAYLAA